MTNELDTKFTSVRVSQVLRILSTSATRDITITQAAEEEGISVDTFERWYDDRKDEIIRILEVIAMARVQEVTQLAQIKQLGIKTLLRRIQSEAAETRDILAILKYVGAELETALGASGAYDETQEQQAQEYARALRGPQLQEQDNRFVLKREKASEEVEEEREYIEGNYTDL